MKNILIVNACKKYTEELKELIEYSDVIVDNIICCNDGKEALEIAKSQLIEAVITDTNLPEIDGFTLVSKLNKINNKPLTAVISDSNRFEDVVTMLRLGVLDYLLKPASEEDITRLLQIFERKLYKDEEQYSINRKLAIQQLQYLLFYDNITASEIENICLKVHNYMPVNNFVVFCIPNRDEVDFTEPGKYYYVQGEEHLDLIICDEKYKEELINRLSDKHIGISNVYYNFMDVKQAFCEAAQMRRTAFETCQKIVDAKYFKKPDKDNEYGVKIMIETANLVCSNNLEEALSRLEKFVSGVKQRQYAFEEFQEQIKIIISTIMKVYQHSLDNKQNEVLEILDIYSYETIDDYMKVFKEWINNFDELVNNQLDEHRTGIKMQLAIDYIKENFASNLNMAVVSNYISMNYSLFSYRFKQYTGTNFVNYLKNIRVGEAKKLLTDTDMRISEIAFTVGYDYEKHFMKIFKGVTGLTPSQYRKNFKG